MSVLSVAILVLIPVCLVIAFLNHNSKKRKKIGQEKLSVYLQAVIEQTGIVPAYQKRLIHQLVVLDEKNRKLLLIDHKNSTFSYNLYPFDSIKNIKVLQQKQTMTLDKGQKSETYITHIGVGVTLENPGTELLLTSYDHVEHTIYQMADYEKEAWEVYENMKKFGNLNYRN